MTGNLTLAAQERIRLYDEFKRKIDRVSKHEAAMERFRARLDRHNRKSYWAIVGYDDRPIFNVELLRTEKLSEMGWLVEEFEAVFGEVVATEDDAENAHMTRRRFRTRNAELLIEVPLGSVACKRTPTGEVKQVEVFKIECVEAAE